MMSQSVTMASKSASKERPLSYSLMKLYQHSQTLIAALCSDLRVAILVRDAKSKQTAPKSRVQALRQKRCFDCAISLTLPHSLGEKQNLKNIGHLISKFVGVMHG